MHLQIHVGYLFNLCDGDGMAKKRSVSALVLVAPCSFPVLWFQNNLAC